MKMLFEHIDPRGKNIGLSSKTTKLPHVTYTFSKRNKQNQIQYSHVFNKLKHFCLKKTPNSSRKDVGFCKRKPKQNTPTNQPTAPLHRPFHGGLRFGHQRRGTSHEGVATGGAPAIAVQAGLGAGTMGIATWRGELGFGSFGVALEWLWCSGLRRYDVLKGQVFSFFLVCL